MAEEQAPKTSALGKRKGRPGDKEKQDALSNKWLTVRTIFARQAATGNFSLLASDATELRTLLDQISEQLPALKDRALAEMELSPQLVILLEETSKGKLRDLRWYTINAKNHLAYSNWLQRNVINGSEDELCIEVHALTVDEKKRNELEADFAEAGKVGKTQKGIARKYIQIARAERGIRNKTRWHLWGLKQITPQVIQQCIASGDRLKDISSDEFFLFRPKARPKKKKRGNKKNRHGPKRRKRAADQGTAVADGEGATSDEEEGIEGGTYGDGEDEEAEEAGGVNPLAAIADEESIEFADSDDDNGGVSVEQISTIEEAAEAVEDNDTNESINNEGDETGLVFRPNIKRDHDEDVSGTKGRLMSEQTLAIGRGKKTDV